MRITTDSQWIRQRGRMGNRLSRFFAMLRSKPTESAYPSLKTARSIALSMAMTGGSTRAHPRMTNRRSWRCWQHSMRFGRGRFRWLHSGHYGNWAPNPAMQLSRLLASMEDAEGRVLIEGYYDDATSLSESEKKALAEMPENDADLERELGIAKPEGGGKKLVELIMQPSLNIRGLRS